MQKYLELLRAIETNGTEKPAARENMPSTQSLFGYQIRHNLADGFPLLTTKKMSFKSILTELLWFLKGDTNIKYLVDKGVNIWNEDAYNFYKKRCVPHPVREAEGSDRRYFNYSSGKQELFTFDEFVNIIKTEDVKSIQHFFGPFATESMKYKFGDCGFQYGKVWRNWEYQFESSIDIHDFEVDQISKLIKGLRENPESRRHIVTSIDPAHDDELALYWCHCLMQFNCRPLTDIERSHYAVDNNIMHRNELMFEQNQTLNEQLNENNIPKYYLDCQLYQRSCDVFLGVPYNIASYALLTHLFAKMCNMIPGEFVHTFGDVHIYSNHKDAILEQTSRIPYKLPTIDIVGIDDWSQEIDGIINQIENSKVQVFNLLDYHCHAAIKAELSTGLKK